MPLRLEDVVPMRASEVPMPEFRLDVSSVDDLLDPLNFPHPYPFPQDL